VANKPLPIAVGDEILQLPPPAVLVIDDEKSMREFLEILLTREGYRVSLAANGLEALKLVQRSRFDLVITDLKLPGMDGIEITRKIKEQFPETEVMVITAFGSTESAVEAMKAGACDYLEKPFKVEEVKHRVSNNLSRLQLERENIMLRRELEMRYGFANIIGTSPTMVRIFSTIRQVANSRTNILITGESGTGKELVAKAIHHSGPRRGEAFVPVNCSAIPETLIESELFGHERGAFTGAVRSKPGLFEVASRGTIFLDEITELSLPTQATLLRAIQEQMIRRVGGTKEIEIDVRFLAATNQDIESEVKAGRFREDLYYRINVIRIDLPPLRERKEDIPILLDNFLEKYARRTQKPVPQVSPEARDLLLRHPFPGNVRELENLIERVLALSTSGFIRPEDILPTLSSTPPKPDPAPREFPLQGIDLETEVETFEKELIQKALQRAGGIKKRAAELLQISFRSLRYKLEKYGLASRGPDGDIEDETDNGSSSF